MEIREKSHGLLCSYSTVGVKFCGAYIGIGDPLLCERLQFSIAGENPGWKLAASIVPTPPIIFVLRVGEF